MTDQDDIWGGCPRRRDVLASYEVDLDLLTAATQLWVIGVGIGVDRLARKPPCSCVCDLVCEWRPIGDGMGSI